MNLINDSMGTGVEEMFDFSPKKVRETRSWSFV